MHAVADSTWCTCRRTLAHSRIRNFVRVLVESNSLIFPPTAALGIKETCVLTAFITLPTVYMGATRCDERVCMYNGLRAGKQTVVPEIGRSTSYNQICFRN